MTTSSARSSNACGGFGPGEIVNPEQPERKAPGSFGESVAAQALASAGDPDDDGTAVPPHSSLAAADEWATPTFILYPNPSVGTATARFDHFEPVVVEVFDAAGRRVSRLTSTPGQTWQIDQTLSRGLFKVIALDAGGRQLQQSLIVQ